MEGLISVIIPVYKVEKFLDKCIKSVVEQLYTNLEIILVDDGSPDKCPIMCDMWAERDKRIKVIHKSNGGLSDARNAGIQIAEGDYISFVDSDDWIAPNMYQIMIDTIQKENADICACGIMVSYSDSEGEKPLNLPSIIGDSEKILELIYNDTQYPVATWNKLYRRKCWKNLRFPVGKICEDAFTTYLLVANAKKIVQISEPLYYYRIRSNSIMTADFNHKRMDEEEAWRYNYEYMKIHYPLISAKAFDFYLQKVNGLIHTIPKSECKVYKVEYEYLRNILKDNFFYILIKSKMKFKYRIKFILDFIRL